MSFDIVPAQPSDIPRLVEIFYDAFDDDVIVGAIERNVEKQAKYKAFEKFYEKMFTQGHLSGERVIKAIDSTTG